MKTTLARLAVWLFAPVALLLCAGNSCGGSGPDGTGPTDCSCFDPLECFCSHTVFTSKQEQPTTCESYCNNQGTGHQTLSSCAAAGVTFVGTCELDHPLNGMNVFEYEETCECDGHKTCSAENSDPLKWAAKMSDDCVHSNGKWTGAN